MIPDITYTYTEAQNISIDIIKNGIFRVGDLVVFKNIPYNENHLKYNKNNIFRILEIHEYAENKAYNGHIRIEDIKNYRNSMGIFAIRVEHYISNDIINF